MINFYYECSKLLMSKSFSWISTANDWASSSIGVKQRATKGIIIIWQKSPEQNFEPSLEEHILKYKLESSDFTTSLRSE